MSQNNFCIYCGAKLNPGDKFCLSCGKPVAAMEEEPAAQPEPQLPVCPSCGAPLQEGQRFCTSCGARVEEPAPAAAQPTVQIGSPADATVAIPHPAAVAPVQPETPAYAGPTYAAPTGRASRHEPNQRTIIIVCACVIAVSLLAIGASLLLSKRSGTPASDTSQEQGGSQPEVQQVVPGASEQDTTNTTTTTQQEDTSAQADAQFHDSVKGYYDALPGYSDQIAGVASTFNATYLKGDLATRQANYQESSSLLSQIVAQRSALANLTAPSGSSWASQYQQVLQCYDYSVARLQCMVDAWAIDVSYGNPEDHQAEILAPIKAGNDTDSKNLAKKEYEALYPQIQL